MHTIIFRLFLQYIYPCVFLAAPSRPTFGIVGLNETWMNVSWVPSQSGNPGSVFYVEFRYRGNIFNHTLFVDNACVVVYIYIPFIHLKLQTILILNLKVHCKQHCACMSIFWSPDWIQVLVVSYCSQS